MEEGTWRADGAWEHRVKGYWRGLCKRCCRELAWDRSPEDLAPPAQIQRAAWLWQGADAMAESLARKDLSSICGGGCYCHACGMACNACLPSWRLPSQREEPTPTSALRWLGVPAGARRQAIPAHSPWAASPPGTALLALLGDFRGAATLVPEPGAGRQA